MRSSFLRSPWATCCLSVLSLISLLGVVDLAGSSASAVSTASTVNQALSVVTVPWLGDPTQPHEVYPGGRIVLQGVAVLGVGDAPATLTSAVWDPGDGTGVIPIDASNGLSLELYHTYQGNPGDTFTATLTVTDQGGTVASATFPVLVKHKTLDVEMNMAIDLGLWQTHKQIVRGELEGVPVGTVPGNYSFAATIASVQAFALHYHLASGDASRDPYVHDVNRLLASLESQLATWTIGQKATGNPDTNGNGIAVSTDFGEPSSSTNYVTGQVMNAFISHGQPDRVAVLGPANVRGRTYRDLVQDMLDYGAWGQMDATFPAPQRGSWYYSHFPGHADNSVAQWVTSGLLAAERVWGLSVPQFVKNENELSTSATFSPNGQWGYASTTPIWHDGAATTPSGVLQKTFSGSTTADPRVAAGLRWIAQYHRTRMTDGVVGESRNFYVLYSTARAYRSLRNPSGVIEPLVMVDDDPADGTPAWDWFRNDPGPGAPASAGPVGMARAVMSRQVADGTLWSRDTNVSLGSLGHPYGLIVLAQSVFEPGPRAVCRATPNPTSGPVTFDASESFHPVSGRQIVSYSWAFGDGATGSGIDVEHAYAPPAELVATRTAMLTVRDDHGNMHTTSCVVTIDTSNAAPVAVNQEYTTPEDQSVAGNVLDSVTDEDGDPLTAVLVAPPTHGGLAFNPDGSFIYVPALDFNGTDVFSFAAHDGRRAGNTATVTLTITPVNDAPFAADQSFGFTEDTAGSGNVLAAAIDIDGDALTAGLVNGPSHGTLELNADGSFTYTPDQDYFGQDTFTFVASDGTESSSVATASLTIAAVNDAPVVADQSFAVDEDDTLTANLLAGASDVDGDTVTATLVTGPSHGTLVLAADGSVVYTPAPDYHGPDGFVFRADDGHGGTAEATVTLTVRPVNDAPEAASLSFDFQEDSPGVGNVLAGATDVDNDDLTASLIAGPSHGTLILNVDGSFTYVPNPNYHGSDAFTFVASDGTASSAVATASLTIASVNDVPVANGNAYTVIENQSVSGQLITDGVPDSDVDGDALVATVGVGPGHGAIVLAPDGSFTYTPAPGFSGLDTMTYVIGDGHGGSASATVVFTVLVANRPPVCSAAVPSQSVLWPANHRMVAITILGVTDQETPDAVTITIDSILQDESTNTRGDGNTPVDAAGLGTSTAQVRAERSGTANGRVYTIAFTATDGGGLSCTGVVKVGVPVDRGRLAVPVDDGPLVDSTVGGGGTPDSGGKSVKSGEKSTKGSVKEPAKSSKTKSVKAPATRPSTKAPSGKGKAGKG